VGTLAHEMPVAPRTEPFTWLWEFLKHELAPYPGRLGTVARMVLAVTLVMIICDTFRVPYAFLGGIYALLISRESPQATLSSAGTVLLLAVSGLAYVLASVQFVVSVPLLHFLWSIGSLFLAFYALTVITNYGAFVAFALVISIAVAIWGRHVPAGTNVADTLWLSLVAFIAVVVTAGVELVFRRIRPGDDIVVPVADRLAAIHSVLICYSEGRSVDQATEEKVIRLGMLGTSTLRRALRRSDYSAQYRTQMSGVVALVGRLVDITTALTQLSFDPASLDREHLRSLAAAVASMGSDLIARRIPGSIPVNTEDEPHRVPLLREMENTVALISRAFTGSGSIDEYQAPEERLGSKLFVPDAFVNREHLRFALKGWFAVSACYVIYNAIDWPGMAIPVMLTCFLTAVSTIGTSRQRQVLRFAGFIVGGLLIGMGAQVFILPYIDSIVGFTVFFALVTALAAWFMTSSPRLSFFGLQLGAVFYVININQKFARETSLSVARDRVAGVFLGLLMMWLIFDQLWSAPASVEMRKVFISTLRLLAQFTREPRRASALHDTINTKFDNVRSLADGVLLEFGPSRRRDLTLRNRIRRWQPQLRALFIMRGAALKYRLQLPGFLLPEAVIAALQAYDDASAQMLEDIADRMEGKTSREGPVAADLLALLEQTLESCRTDESRLLFSEHRATFIPLLREIDQLTSRLASEIAMETDRPDQRKIVRRPSNPLGRRP
jgi:multidrug resistance protein MdtO